MTMGQCTGFGDYAMGLPTTDNNLGPGMRHLRAIVTGSSGP